MSDKNKKIIITVVVLIAIFFGYNTFFVSDGPDTLLTSTGATDSTSLLGADIIKAINQIDSLELDRNVFDDPVYRSLVYRGEDINPEPVGRNNPFARIGEGGSPVSESATTTDSE